MEVAEHLPKRARVEEHDHGWDLDELHDYLQEDGDLSRISRWQKKKTLPPQRIHLMMAIRWQLKTAGLAVNGVANQMAHYGGCIEDPSA